MLSLFGVTVVVYFIQNDILVTGKDDADHAKTLEAVLNRLDENGLRLKVDKCTFMQKSITYMGCINSVKGIYPTEETIEAIKKAPIDLRT